MAVGHERVIIWRQGDGQRDAGEQIAALGVDDINVVQQGRKQQVAVGTDFLSGNRTHVPDFAADLNGDHLPDLIFSNQSQIAIIHNAGNRTYSAESHYLAGTVGTIAVADLNGDGFPDLAVASSGSTVAVLLNQPTGKLSSGVFTVSPEPSTFTKPFSMTLTLAPFKTGTGTPTGTVTFSIDGNPVATVPLSGDQASYSYAGTLSLGAHAIWATYNGDANFVPSYFIEQHQIIPIVYPTTIALTATPTAVLAGQTISFHAAVKSPGQPPYGIVSFLDGTTPIGSQPLDANSLAVFDTSLLSPGKHSISADFLGNQNFAAVKSAAVNVTVNVNQTAAKLSVNPTSVAVGAPVALTATITSPAGTPAGSAAFSDGGTLLQNVALDGTGVAVYGATFSTAGTHVITASYPANGSFAGSNASAVNVTVTSAAAANATSTSIIGAANPQVVRGFTFTATVQSTNNKPSGDVVFQNGDSILATVALDDMGSAVYSSASLGPGVQYISAAYSGGTGLARSVSSVLVETIPAEVPDFSMTLSPPDLLVLSSGSVSSQVIVQAMDGFNQSVGLTCSTGTAQLNCSLQSVNLPNGAGTSKLTITRTGTGASALPVSRTWIRTAMLLLGLPLLVAVRFKRGKSAGLLVALMLLGGTLSCGSPKRLPAARRYVVIITGSSQQTNGAILHTVSVNVAAPSRWATGDDPPAVNCRVVILPGGGRSHQSLVTLIFLVTENNLRDTQPGIQLPTEFLKVSCSCLAGAIPGLPTTIQNRRVRSELHPRLEGDHARTAIATQSDA